MAYFSCLQMDVNWFITMMKRKPDMNIGKLNNEEKERLFRYIIEASIRGVQGDNPYFNMLMRGKDEALYHTCFSFIYTWISDVIHCEWTSKGRTLDWKIYKKVICEYFDIDEFNRKHEMIKNGKNLCEDDHMSIDEFKSYCLFDVEAMYNKGILNNTVLDNLDKNKKYYLINAFNPCVYDREFTYKELCDLLKNESVWSSIPKDNIISVFSYDFKLSHYIVREDYFNDMQSIDEYLSKVNFYLCNLHELFCNYDNEKVKYHMKRFYDFESLDGMKKYGKILKTSKDKSVEFIFDLLRHCFGYDGTKKYLKKIDRKIGNGKYFTKEDWFQFGEYI